MAPARSSWSSGDVWHQTLSQVDWRNSGGSMAGHGTLIDKFSDFKRFRTTAQIVSDDMTDATMPLPAEK